MNDSEVKAQAVAAAVLKKSKYCTIQPALVLRLAARELEHRRSDKEAIKEVSAKLHQIGAAYFKLSPQYVRWREELRDLPNDPQHELTRAFCLKVMRAHSSTAERLPILADMYREVLAPLGPLESILDLACGLNPLALAWMPLAPGAQYYGCDIFSDLIDFNNAFLAYCGLRARLVCADLFEWYPLPQVRLALLLKSLPCLEQLEKGRGLGLLQAIPAEYILVSYPIRSLGGRARGMRQTYAAQFAALAEGQDWQVTHFEFASELAYLIRKSI